MTETRESGRDEALQGTGTCRVITCILFYVWWRAAGWLDTGR